MSSSRVADIIDLASSVFDSSGIPDTNVTALPTLTGALRKIKVYQMGEDQTDFQKQILAYLTLCGRSASSLPSVWESWVLSYVCVAFPGLGSMIANESSGEIHLESLPADFMVALRNADQALENEQGDTIIPDIPNLPRVGGTYDIDLFNGTSIVPLYGYLALLVFLMGKQITDQNRANFMLNRPKNIIDKFAVEEDQRFILSGAGRLTEHAVMNVNKAWANLTPARKVIVSEFVKFSHSRTQAQEVVFFMFRMLEHSQMQPAYFIHQLVKSVPEVSTIPILRTPFEAYAQSVRDFLKIHPSLRPYVKVMFGDSTKLFHSKTLQDLTACAVLWCGQDNETVRAYEAPGGEKAKAQFKAKCLELGIELIEFSKITTATVNI